MRSRIPYVQRQEPGYASIVFPAEPPKQFIDKVIQRGWVDRSRSTQLEDSDYLLELWGSKVMNAFVFMLFLCRQETEEN